MCRNTVRYVCWDEEREGERCMCGYVVEYSEGAVYVIMYAGIK